MSGWVWRDESESVDENAFSDRWHRTGESKGWRSRERNNHWIEGFHMLHPLLPEEDDRTAQAPEHRGSGLAVMTGRSPENGIVHSRIRF